MEVNEQKLLDTPGEVKVSLPHFLYLRDSLELLLKTTKTHKELLKTFRLSLLFIIQECKKEGVDLSELYKYYKNLETPTISGVYFNKELQQEKEVLVLKLEVTRQNEREDEEDRAVND